MNRTWLLRGVAAVAASCLALTLASCASAKTTKNPEPRANAQLHANLPSDIRDRGSIHVLTDASYAPASSFAPDGHTIVGFEPDLGAALGQVLGVRVVFENADFSKLPILVQQGQGDMIMSAMTDTAERERQLDFVDYFSAGTSVVVQRGNSAGITDLQSLCGKNVAVESGTTQATLLDQQQKNCGSTRMHLIVEPTNDDAILQLRIGKAAAMLMDYPPADVLTTDPRTRPHYQLASTTQYEPGLYGMGFPKTSRALRDTVQAALSQLMADGTYRKVLEKWSVLGGAIKQTAINGGA